MVYPESPGLLLASASRAPGLQALTTTSDYYKYAENQIEVLMLP